jgi:hypothetical protein
MKQISEEILTANGSYTNSIKNEGFYYNPIKMSIFSERERESKNLRNLNGLIKLSRFNILQWRLILVQLHIPRGRCPICHLISHTSQNSTN